MDNKITAYRVEKKKPIGKFTKNDVDYSGVGDLLDD